MNKLYQYGDLSPKKKKNSLTMENKMKKEGLG